jgi:hypothetical protein
MSGTCFRRTAALVLVLALLASAAVAGEARLSVPAPVGAFSTLWHLLTTLWSEAGCHLDPYGRCIDDVGSTGDAGCSADPFGRCTTASSGTDAGCRADPYGRCLSTASDTDAGCHADPYGRCGS